jgi:L-iditol 2-dehydrogenase
MRSVQLLAPRVLEQRAMPDPADPGPGEVIVKLRAVGICGSDMHWYLHGRIGAFPASYPQVLGHEPAGVIIAVGNGVTDRKIGDRVSIEPSLTCGHCEYCRTGHPNNCPSTVFLGSPQAPGLFRDYVLLPARNTDLVPANLDWSQASLIEPVAVMVHILELAEIRLGDIVAVMGAGPIGMLCASIAKIAGASQVFICDKLPHRIELARRMGADVAVESTRMGEAVRDGTHGRGADVVMDAAGAVESLNLGIALARPGGTVVFIGIPTDAFLSLDVHTAMNKELRLQTIKRSNHKAEEAAQLLAAGRVPDALITHRLPFEQTARGFELLATYSDNVGKVVIEL